MPDGGFQYISVVGRGHLVGVTSWGHFRTSELGHIDIEIDYWERIWSCTDSNGFRSPVPRCESTAAPSHI